MLRPGSKILSLDKQNDETGLVVKFKVMNKYNFYEKTGLS